LPGKKRIIFYIHRKTKRHLMVIPAVLLATILVCSAIMINSAYSPLAGKHIIIDPGHGGIDPGANDKSGFAEKDINLQIALKLRELLLSEKANVEMTRDMDISLDGRNELSSSRHKRDLLARVEMFNSGKYDLFISIHVNRSSNPKAMGPITLYGGNLPSSALLAYNIQEKLNLLMKQELKVDINRKPAKEDFFILRHSKIPGVLVETGFMSNNREKKLLKDTKYQEKIAKHICLGIADYLRALDESGKNTPGDNSPGPEVPTQEHILPPNGIYDIQLVEK